MKNSFNKSSLSKTLKVQQIDYSLPSYLPTLQPSKFAFTLAEVLITLAVVGVVAAMTLPVLINKIKDREYDRAREKALMSIGEAGRLLAIQGEIGSGVNAEDFVKNYLSKKLKIVKTCDNDNLEKCGLPAEIKKLESATTMSMPKTQAQLGLSSIYRTSSWKNATNYGFLTANGYSVNLFYNPKCTAEDTSTRQTIQEAPNYTCFNAIYDMNGFRNPNQVGKDVGFVTVFYPNETTRAVAPNPVSYSSWGSWYSANNKCASLGKEYSMADKEELSAMAVNGELLNMTGRGITWSSSTRVGYPDQAWRVYFDYGTRQWWNKSGDRSIVCVKR